MDETKTMNEEIKEAGSERLGIVDSYESEVCEEASKGSGALKLIGIVGGVAALGTAICYGANKVSKKLIRGYVERHPKEFEDIYFAIEPEDLLPECEDDICSGHQEAESEE